MKSMLRRHLASIARHLPVIGPHLRQHDRLRESFCSSHPPGHYYSPIADLASVRAQSERIWPRDKPTALPGIDLNEAYQLDLLAKLGTFHNSQPFHPHKADGLRYYFENNYYSYSDGIVYHCLLRHLRPERVIEIGSGFSSCVLLDTNEGFLSNSIQCTFIEPNPERLLMLLQPKDSMNLCLLRQDLQDVDPRIFDSLKSGDLLFIDSSHVAKTGSDVNLLFSRIIPSLARGVHVHIHDILYPFEYPQEYVYRKWAWNELYMLRACLQTRSG